MDRSPSMPSPAVRPRSDVPQLPGTAAIARLLDQAATLDPDSDPIDLARWRAAAFVVIERLCPNDDYVWTLLRPATDWSRPPDPREWNQHFTSGWAITMGVLDALQHLGCGTGADPRPAATPSPSLQHDQRLPHQPRLEKEPELLRELARRGPVIRLLGRVDILGAEGDRPTDARTSYHLAWAAAWIHLNPHAPCRELDQVVWNRRLIRNRTRRKFLDSLADWIGPVHLPPAHRGQGFAFAPTVTSDWAQFQHYYRLGRRTGPGPEGDRALRTALDLVHGEPCSTGKGADAPLWTMHHSSVMACEILDAVQLLFQRSLDASNLTTALWAAERAMLLASAAEREQLAQVLGSLAAGDPRAAADATALVHALRTRFYERDPHSWAGVDHLDVTTELPPDRVLAVDEPGPDDQPGPAGEPAVHRDASYPALAEPVDEPDYGPVLRLLGPVDVIGAEGRLDPYRRAPLTELASWLYLHPGSRYQDLDQAMWPGQRIGANTRNTTTSRLRAWLGAEHFPKVDAVAGYGLAPTVGSDWEEFELLRERGTTTPGPRGEQALALALELVRGQPFGAHGPSEVCWTDEPPFGRDDQEPAPGPYWWAAPYAAAMRESIIDVAENLAERRRAAGDIHGALEAARRGLLAQPGHQDAAITWDRRLLDPYDDLARSLAELRRHRPAALSEPLR